MEPFENDKNQNTEPVMAENMTSAPAKRYEGKSFIFSDIPSQEKIIQVLCTPFGLDPEGMGDTLVLHLSLIHIYKQTSSWYFDPSYSGQIHTPLRASSSIPLNIRKVIGRRAAMLLKSDVIINVGTGIPNDVIGPILAEEDVQDDVMLTVESGIYGGVPAGGIDFGISCSPQALIPHDRQFEYYTCLLYTSAFY